MPFITCLPLEQSFESSRKLSISEEPIVIGRQLGNEEDEKSLLFKSRVISRKHAILFMKHDKVVTALTKLYIQDTRSSSGTFINDARLSPKAEESVPVQIKSGDVVQLGLDYDSGDSQYQPIKFEIICESISPAGSLVEVTTGPEAQESRMYKNRYTYLKQRSFIRTQSTLDR